MDRINQQPARTLGAFVYVASCSIACFGQLTVEQAKLPSATRSTTTTGFRTRFASSSGSVYMYFLCASRTHKTDCYDSPLPINWSRPFPSRSGRVEPRSRSTVRIWPAFTPRHWPGRAASALLLAICPPRKGKGFERTRLVREAETAGGAAAAGGARTTRARASGASTAAASSSKPHGFASIASAGRVKSAQFHSWSEWIACSSRCC